MENVCLAGILPFSYEKCSFYYFFPTKNVFSYYEKVNLQRNDCLEKFFRQEAIAIAGCKAGRQNMAYAGIWNLISPEDNGRLSGLS
jgi:hypothetical protein